MTIYELAESITKNKPIRDSFYNELRENLLSNGIELRSIEPARLKGKLLYIITYINRNGILLSYNLPIEIPIYQDADKIAKDLLMVIDGIY